jgi:hypothetical protein
MGVPEKSGTQKTDDKPHFLFWIASFRHTQKSCCELHLEFYQLAAI